MNLRLTGFQKLALTTIVAVYVMIVIGVIVRSTGSGLGCGDWPLCRGAIIPALDGPNAWDRADWIESIHRWWGVIVGFLVLGLGVQAWRVAPRHPLDRGRPRSSPSCSPASRPGWASGPWRSGNSAESVTAHLADVDAHPGRHRSSSSSARATRPSLPQQRRPASASRSSSRFAAASVYVLMLFGSNVTVNAASLVFPDWPLFDGQLIPTWNDEPGRGAAADASLRASHRGRHRRAHHALGDAS